MHLSLGLIGIFSLESSDWTETLAQDHRIRIRSVISSKLWAVLCLIPFNWTEFVVTFSHSPQLRFSHNLDGARGGFLTESSGSEVPPSNSQGFDAEITTECAMGNEDLNSQITSLYNHAEAAVPAS